LLGVSKAKRNKKTGAFELPKPTVGTPLSILWSKVSDKYVEELQNQIKKWVKLI
jgi:hypothetical protein